MSKISELSDGGSLVSSDYLIAVRSGGNVKVRMDQINVDQVDLGDNEFIRLGNSQDLTMVHNASNSIINQAGIGDLLLQKAGVTKLTINASGIDVTGSVTADGLTVTEIGTGTGLGGVIASTITAGGNAGYRFVTGGVDRFSLSIIGAAGSESLRVYDSNNSAERMRVDASGNVGIGETVPLGKLHVKSADSGASVNVNGNTLVVENSGTTGLSILSGTTGDGNIFFSDLNNNLAGKISYSHNGDYITILSSGASLFYNAGAESMRIDALGNLLVGTTSTSGGRHFTIGNATAPSQSFQQNGTEKFLFGISGTTNGGVTGSASGDYFARTTGGKMLFSTNDGVTAHAVIDSSGHAIIPAGVTLGTAAGVYNAANTLDDYEEGTWTGTLIGTVSAPSTAITATGRYTKIGRLVTAIVAFDNTDSTGASGNISVTGLPFTALNGGIGAGWHSRSNTGSGTTNGIMSYIGSTNELALVNGIGNAITWASAGTGTYAQFSVTYTT